MADAYDVTYEAVLGAIVTAVKTAWSLTDAQVIVGEPEMVPDTAPLAHVMTPRIITRNRSPITDECTLEWTMSYAFERVEDEQTDVTRAKAYTQLQAELYGVLNLGTYAYLGQLLGYEVAETTLSTALAMSVSFQCNIEVAAQRG